MASGNGVVDIHDVLLTQFNVCQRLNLRPLAHGRLVTGLPYNPLDEEWLFDRAWQKPTPERLFLRRSQATEIASVETESTETCSKVHGNNFRS